jgi:hypothetical protein
MPEPGSGSEFSVNGYERIKAAIFAMVIADEPIFGSDLDVAVILIAVNQNRADRSGVGIANRQSSESVTVH